MVKTLTTTVCPCKNSLTMTIGTVHASVFCGGVVMEDKREIGKTGYRVKNKYGKEGHAIV